MTTLRDIFDYGDFQDAVYQGYIRVQTHENEPLSIANYTEKAQYERLWTPEILASRGLVYNSLTLDVVARGFPKFFNFDDTSQPNPPVGPMIRSTKFDGSLGILYRQPIGGDMAIATRGSFASDQANHATQRLFKYFWDWDGVNPFQIQLHDGLNKLIQDNYTALFEIIYPQNRIVVNYGVEDKLVLLDVIENATGRSDLARFDALDWPDKADKQLIPGGFFDTIAGDIPEGEEGFVLYWPSHDFRCKVKSAEYVELHRMVTGLSEKTVWEWIGSGKSVADIKEKVPDELYGWVDDVVAKLNDKAAAFIDTIYADYDELLASHDGDLVRAAQEGGKQKYRAVFARYAGNPLYINTRPYLFLLLDDKQPEDIWKVVWRTLKPAGDTRAFAQSEDVA